MEPEQPIEPLAKPRRRRLWTVLLALAIFSCGVLVGGAFKIVTAGCNGLGAGFPAENYLPHGAPA
jgi:hypothetical protein